MDIDNYMKEMEKNVILGHIDRFDEGFNGDMQGSPGVSEIVEIAIKQKTPSKIILDTLSSGMEVVGQKFESGEYMMPDVIASAECVCSAVDMLDLYNLEKENINRKGTFVIATVQGDLHDIGKNIVATILKGDGYEVRDLGNNVEAGKIIEAVRNYNAEFLGLSALLTTTMVNMKSVVELLESEGLRDKVTVLIGGAATTPEYAKKINADAHCKDAFSALETIKYFKEYSK